MLASSFAPDTKSSLMSVGPRFSVDAQKEATNFVGPPGKLQAAVLRPTGRQKQTTAANRGVRDSFAQSGVSERPRL